MMSLFKPMNLRCPACRKENNAQVAGSINADRRPDLREAILADTFQDTRCVNCGTQFRNESDLNLLDVGRRQWIAAFPARAMVDHLEREQSASESFDKAYGVQAQPAAQAIGRELELRVTFGWPALREKLLARDLGLDDVVLECMKLDLLRRLPEVPLAPGTELRLAGLEDRTMTFLWVNALTEEAEEQVTLDRALYDVIAEDPDGWAEVRDELTRGPFVDMQRLFMGAGTADSAGEQSA